MYTPPDLSIQHLISQILPAPQIKADLDRPDRQIKARIDNQSNFNSITAMFIRPPRIHILAYMYYCHVNSMTATKLMKLSFISYLGAVR
jgi:hypothetical protein